MNEISANSLNYGEAVSLDALTDDWMYSQQLGLAPEIARTALPALHALGLAERKRKGTKPDWLWRYSQVVNPSLYELTDLAAQLFRDDPIPKHNQDKGLDPLSVDILRSPLKHWVYSQARKALCLALYRRGVPYARTARWLNRDHTSAMFLANQARNRAHKIPEFRSRVLRIVEHTVPQPGE